MKNLAGLALFGLWVMGTSPAWGTLQLFGTQEGLNHPTVTACDLDQDWIWVGTEKGLSVRRPGQKRFTSVTALHERISALAAQGDTAWVGTHQGLFRITTAGSVPEDWRQRSGTQGGEVYTLVKDLAGRIWQGSATGLAVLKRGAGAWQNLPLPAGITGPVRAIHPMGSLCFVSAATPDILIYDLDSGRWLRRSPPEGQVPITGITSYGASLYLGTDGQGLWRCQWGSNQWEKITTRPDNANQFVLVAVANGRSAWFGTFDGLVALRQDNGQTMDRPDLDDLPAGAVTSLACADQQLLIGTESGLALLILEEPQVACQPQRNIILSPPSAMVFDGLAQSRDGLKVISAEFAVQSLPDTWFAANLTLGAPDAQGRMRGSWRIADLPSSSDFYLLRLRVIDQRGQTNTALTQIVIAPQEPQLAFNAVEGQVNPGLQTVMGTLNTPFASEVVINPGDFKARLNPETGSFHTTLNLLPGKNNLRARLLDWFGRKAEAVLTIEAVEAASEDAVTVKTSETGEETLTLNEVLLFDSGSVEIKPSGYAALAKVVDYLNRDENLLARIEGHTDNVPIRNARFLNNAMLSKGRARSVFNYFVRANQVAARRLTVSGLGETRPIASNQTAAGRAKNRRVEIVVQPPHAEAP